MHLLDSDIEVNARRSRCSRSGEDAARGAPPEERAAGASTGGAGRGAPAGFRLDYLRKRYASRECDCLYGRHGSSSCM
jgi:hypothetical protein